MAASMAFFGIVGFVALLAFGLIVQRTNMDNERTRTTPRDFFMHLGVMVTLYVSVVSLLVLLFQVINYAFPDALDRSYYYGSYNPYSEAVRWAIAALIVVFPLLYFLSRVLHRDYVTVPEKRALPLRKWLVYLTLFVAGLAIMVDLIVLLNTFLGGEITTRFVLKALSVLAVAGLVFGYYTYDLRHDIVPASKAARAFLGVAALIILASIVTGFSVMGSPSRQRNAEFDQRKTNDLQSIQWQIVNHWQRKQALPAALDDLNDPIGGYVVPTDPQTGASYEYRTVPGGQPSFELCATFNGESLKRPMPGNEMTAPSRAFPYDARNEVWEHPAGRHCFDRSIDPELYPPLDAYGRPLAEKPAVPAQPPVSR